MLPRFLRVITSVVRGGGVEGGGGGVPVWLGGVRSLMRFFYLGLQFNLPSQFQIPDPIPDPVPKGYWVSDLRGSSVSRTSQRRLRCNRLPTPILAKGVLPFYIP